MAALISTRANLVSSASSADTFLYGVREEAMVAIVVAIPGREQEKPDTDELKHLKLCRFNK